MGKRLFSQLATAGLGKTRTGCCGQIGPKVTSIINIFLHIGDPPPPPHPPHPTTPTHLCRVSCNLLNAAGSPDQDATSVIKKARASCRLGLSWGRLAKPNCMLFCYLRVPLIKPFEIKFKYLELLKILKLYFPNIVELR